MDSDCESCFSENFWVAGRPVREHLSEVYGRLWCEYLRQADLYGRLWCEYSPVREHESEVYGRLWCEY